jgi:hypothetical protein
VVVESTGLRYEIEELSPRGGANWCQVLTISENLNSRKWIDE